MPPLSYLLLASEISLSHVLLSYPRTRLTRRHRISKAQMTVPITSATYQRSTQCATLQLIIVFVVHTPISGEAWAFAFHGQAARMTSEPTILEPSFLSEETIVLVL